MMTEHAPKAMNIVGELGTQVVMLGNDLSNRRVKRISV